MTPSIQFPKLVLFGRGKLKRYQEACRKIAIFSFAQLLFIGGHAGMAYGVWMFNHPLGVIVGGWFSVKIALLVSSAPNYPTN